MPCRDNEKNEKSMNDFKMMSILVLDEIDRDYGYDQHLRNLIAQALEIKILDNITMKDSDYIGFNFYLQNDSKEDGIRKIMDQILAHVSTSIFDYETSVSSVISEYYTTIDIKIFYKEYAKNS